MHGQMIDADKAEFRWSAIKGRFGNADAYFMKTIRKYRSEVIPAIGGMNNMFFILDVLRTDAKKLVISEYVDFAKSDFGDGRGLEYRVFVCDGKMSGMSENHPGRKGEAPRFVIDFAEEFHEANTGKLADNYVFDIGIRKKGG